MLLLNPSPFPSEETSNARADISRYCYMEELNIFMQEFFVVLFYLYVCT